MSRAAESRTATVYARVREHLACLGLATASEHLAAELERARDEAVTPVEVLERLLATEAEATSARRLSGRLRFALRRAGKALLCSADADRLGAVDP